jgi:glycosyltransferase involved in cell wall biosynthesis
MTSPGISLVTPTQIGRIQSIFLLKDMLLEQTYISKVREWVISTISVDMGPHIVKLQSELTAGWAELKLDGPAPKIIVVQCELDSKIGRLRNKANNACKEDIIICMDDDDYYPPERLETAYNALISSELLIAGCSPTFIYDFVFEHQYQFISLGDKHSINCAMAFKKSYLANHQHDENVENAEEFSFTALFTEPMIPLDPLRTINVSSHMQNTYNKRYLLVAFHQGRFPKFENVAACLTPKKWYDAMKLIFLGKPDDTGYNSPYDIVYFTGETIKWHPADESLGGSEQAIKHLATNWAAAGKKVAVFSQIDTGEQLPDAVHSVKRQGLNYKGVDYINWLNFPYHQTFKTLILWRSAGLAFTFFVKIKAKQILLDLHDNARVVPIMDVYRAFIQSNRCPDRIMFKSNYHRTEFVDTCKKTGGLPLMGNETIPNGLRVDEFKKFADVAREPFRFCYASCYTRGLEHILTYIWPEIIKAQPQAECHVYYGMDLVGDAAYKTKMHALIGGSKNVMNHGRMPLEVIAVEKYKSSFQLYITDSPAEIDCISIREAVLCGCIPLLANKGVFVERDGIKLGTITDVDTAETYTAMGRAIGEFIQKSADVQAVRNQLKNSIMLTDWKDVADSWLKIMYQDT